MDRLPRLDGGSLYLDAAYRLPKRCLRCGATDQLKQHKEVLYHFPTGKVFTSMLLMGWIGYLIARRFSPSSPVRYHLCAPCFETSTSAFGAEGASGILGSVGLLAGLAFLLNGHEVIGSVVACVVWAVALWVFLRYRKGKRLTVTLVRSNLIRVTGTELTSIEDWPHQRTTNSSKRDLTGLRCPYCAAESHELKLAAGAVVCRGCGRSFS